MKRFEVDAFFEEVFNALSVMEGVIYSRRWDCDTKREWASIAVRKTTFWTERSLMIMLERVKQGVVVDVISMLTFKYGFVHSRNINRVRNYLQINGFKVSEIAAKEM